MPGFSRFTGYSGGCLLSTSGGEVGWGDAVDFAPMLALLCFSGYTGASLWRYGTTISTDVRATSVNPWGALLLAAGGLAGGWALSPAAWPLPYATNAMLLALLWALVLTQACVEGNLRTLAEWDAILETANTEGRVVGVVVGVVVVMG